MLDTWKDQLQTPTRDTCGEYGSLELTPTMLVPHAITTDAAWRTGMRVEQQRANVFTLTLTGQELSLLIAAGRMSLDAMRTEGAPAETMAPLARVLADYDTAMRRDRGSD
jgi:hypothetical protein